MNIDGQAIEHIWNIQRLMERLRRRQEERGSPRIRPGPRRRPPLLRRLAAGFCTVTLIWADGGYSGTLPAAGC